MVDEYYNRSAWYDPLGKKCNPEIKDCSYEFGPGGEIEFKGTEENSDNTLNQSVNCAGGSETTVGEPGSKKQELIELTIIDVMQL